MSRHERTPPYLYKKATISSLKKGKKREQKREKEIVVNVLELMRFEDSLVDRGERALKTIHQRRNDETR